LKSVLIDSDILIEVARARNDGILLRWDELSCAETPLLCSPVTVAELWYGAFRKSTGPSTRFLWPSLAFPSTPGLEYRLENI
jgi:predicted nucleic acid-binding protein